MTTLADLPRTELRSARLSDAAPRPASLSRTSSIRLKAPKLGPALHALALVGRSLAPLIPALAYLLGLACLVYAAFLLAPVAGFAALGLTLIVIGYMVEVNQGEAPGA